MKEDLMEDFKIFYDEVEDILYLAREGEEEEVLEVSPGVNMELDASGKLIGVEIFKASMRFKDVIKQMEKRLQVA
jgi:uncharacterized protein YuzE